MLKGEKSFVLIAAHHIATKNSCTVRARLFFRDLNGNVYSFDADAVTFEMEKLRTTAESGILGVAR